MSWTNAKWVAVLVTIGCAAEVEYRRPTVRYEAAPTMVEVSPGVSVVEDSNDEVFYSGGYYWVQSDGHWWQSRDYRGDWVVAETHVVPEKIRVVPAGQYRHYRPSPAVEEHRVVEEHPVEPTEHRVTPVQ